MIAKTVKTMAAALVAGLLAAGSCLAESPTWTRRTSATGGIAEPGKVLCDTKGNALVCGVLDEPGKATSTLVLEKRSPAGAKIWARERKVDRGARVMDAALDAKDNLIVALSVPDVTATILVKFAPSGTHQWTVVRQNPQGYVSPKALQVDAAGNLFALLIETSTQGQAPAVAKVTPSGSLAWSWRGTPSQGWFIPMGLALDGAGGAYVASTLMDPGTYAALLHVARLDAKGAPLWGKKWSAPGAAGTLAAGLAAAPSGGAIVVGSTLNAGDYSSSSLLTARFSAAGKPLWSRIYRGPLSAEFGVGVVANARGEIYVAGYGAAEEDESGHFNFVAARYSASGGLLWLHHLNPHPLWANDLTSGVSLGRNGLPYLFGTSDPSGSGPNTLSVVGMSPTGGTPTVGTYGTTAPVLIEARSAAADGKGVYLLGSETLKNGDKGWMLARFLQ